MSTREDGFVRWCREVRRIAAWYGLHTDLLQCQVLWNHGMEVWDAVKQIQNPCSLPTIMPTPFWRINHDVCMAAKATMSRRRESA